MNDYPRRQDTDTQNQRRNDELRKSRQTSFAPAPSADAAFEAFRKAYDAASVRPLFPHESPEIRVTDREVADNAPEQANRVLRLIKAAHDSPGRWEPFAANQSIAKLLQDSVGAGERGEIFQEGSQTLVRISKSR